MSKPATGHTAGAEVEPDPQADPAGRKVEREHTQDPRRTDPEKPIHAPAPESVDMTKYGDQLIEAEQERMKRAKEAKDKQTAEEYDREQERIKKTRVKG